MRLTSTYVGRKVNSITFETKSVLDSLVSVLRVVTCLRVVREGIDNGEIPV